MKAKTILLSFLFLSVMFLGLSVFATAQSSGGGGGGSGAKIFYIDDTFKITYTDGTDTYEAEYKVWKIEENDGKNVTTLTGLPWGGIAVSNDYEGKEISLSNIGKMIFSKVYISGDEKYIAITLENAQFKEDDSSSTPPSSGSGGGGTTTNNTGGGGQGGGCYDTDGGKDFYEKGIAAGIYDSCISKYKLSERYCTANNEGADYIKQCPIGYLCDDGACAQSDEDDRENQTTTPTTAYFKFCSYIWDSSNYVGQNIKISANIKDSTGNSKSDSVEVEVVDGNIGSGGSGRPMDGKTLDIQINEPTGTQVRAGAVEIKISSKGPNELGEMSLGFSGDNWGAGFPISNRNCVSGGSSGGRGSGGSNSTCEKYYTCEDGTEVQYCEIVKQYDENGNVVGAGCGCKSNPEKLCTSSSSGGGGGSGEPIEIPSSGSSGGGGGSSGNNATPIICNGCILGDKCVPVGYRTNDKYCNIESELVNQLEADNSCNNNFECSTNLCIDNQCVSSGVWQKFIRWLSRIFG